LQLIDFLFRFAGLVPVNLWFSAYGRESRSAFCAEDCDDHGSSFGLHALQPSLHG
jgi:hypothetical protein